MPVAVVFDRVHGAVEIHGAVDLSRTTEWREENHVQQKPLTEMGRRIRLGMTAAGITSAAALARQIEVSDQTIYRWLHEPLATVDAQTLFDISDRLNLSARWLLSGEADPTPPMAVKPNEAHLILTYRTLSSALQDRLIQCANDLARVV